MAILGGSFEPLELKVVLPSEREREREREMDVKILEVNLNLTSF